MMNEHDRSNLEFLLNASPEVLKDWESKMPADDIEYAQELLNIYSLELKERALALKIECEMELAGNYHEANMVIDKIRKL
jgi:hypothetical protein